MKIDSSIFSDDLTDAIDKTRASRKHNKMWARFTAISISAAAALTTLLVGLSKFYPDQSDCFQVLAMLAGFFTSVISGVSVFHSFSKQWESNARAHRSFLRINEKLKHCIATNSLTDDVLAELFKEYSEVYDTLNSEWDGIRKKADG